MTYQKKDTVPELNDDVTTVKEEKVGLLVGYGSVQDNDDDDENTNDRSWTNYGIYSDNVDGKDVLVLGDGRKVQKKWAWLAAGLVLYAGSLAVAWNHQPDSGARLVLSENQQDILDVELLGKSRKKGLKSSKKDAKEKKPKFEPVPYPSCPSGVDVQYVKERLTFKEHEVAAAAADCHLASIHSIEENSKYSKSGLFKMSYGPEIAQSFMSGKPLEQEFWLGGSIGEDGNWTWTDDSPWGEVELAVAGLKAPKTGGCLSSKFSFIEIAIKDVPTLGHWTVEDCDVPLPAVYKCCIPTPSPTSAPTEAPTSDAIKTVPGEETGVTPGVVPGETPGVVIGFVPGEDGVVKDEPKADATSQVTPKKVNTPGEVPGVVPGQVPGVNPGQTPGVVVGEVSGDNGGSEPESETTEKPKKAKSKKPTKVAADEPGQIPGVTPGETPGVVIGFVPGEDGAISTPSTVKKGNDDEEPVVDVPPKPKKEKKVVEKDIVDEGPAGGDDVDDEPVEDKPVDDGAVVDEPADDAAPVQKIPKAKKPKKVVDESIVKEEPADDGDDDNDGDKPAETAESSKKTKKTKKVVDEPVDDADDVDNADEKPVEPAETAKKPKKTKKVVDEPVDDSDDADDADEKPVEPAEKAKKPKKTKKVVDEPVDDADDADDADDSETSEVGA